MDTETFYNNIANRYEYLLETPEIGASILNKIKDILDTENIKEGSILDLGCGPGNLKTVLGNTFIYTGIDIAESMLKLAKEKGYKTIKGNIVEQIQKIPAKSFDYVIASSSLHFIKDINQLLIEIERITKKAFIISLDQITENYKRGFGAICTDPIYNHFPFIIKDLDIDTCFIGWKSPRDGEEIKVRLLYKNFREVLFDFR